MWNLALKVHTHVYIHIKKKKEKINYRLKICIYIMANRIDQYNSYEISCI